MENLPTDHFVRIFQYTKTVHRDQYPAIDPTSPALSMAGKVAIVTGASKGIGARGIAPAFAKAGAKAVVLVGRDAQRTQAVADEVARFNPTTQVVAEAVSVSDPEAVDALFGRIVERFGHADVLVNNAGLQGSVGLIADVDPRKWWADFEVNTFGPFLMTRAFVRALPETSQGTIINIITGSAHLVIPTMSSYAISKLAAAQLAAFSTAEKPNIAHMALDPGIVATDMSEGDFSRFALDTPELVGGMTVWLATDAARFLAGRYLVTNWDVEELVARKDEIANGTDLKVDVLGKFGPEQFA